MENPEVFNKVFAINVDVQNDFCPGGALGVNEGDRVVEPLNRINKWVREQNVLAGVTNSSAKVGRVVFTADAHPRKTAHFIEDGGPWVPHCIRYTAGAAFHDDLIIEDGDTIANKGMGNRDDGYSGWGASLSHDSPLWIPEYTRGFYQETLAQAVKHEAGVESKHKYAMALLIGGLATDYCVKATVLDALKATTEAREYDTKNNRDLTRIGVFVIEDAIRAVDVNPGDGDRAIEEMQAAGAIFVTSDDVVNGKVLEVAR